jgi:hypothetical protein
VKGTAKLAPGPGNVRLAERDEPAPEAGEAPLEVRLSTARSLGFDTTTCEPAARSSTAFDPHL